MWMIVLWGGIAGAATALLALSVWLAWRPWKIWFNDGFWLELEGPWDVVCFCLWYYAGIKIGYFKSQLQVDHFKWFYRYLKPR